MIQSIYGGSDIFLKIANLIIVFVSTLLSAVLLLVSVQSKGHSRRMGWFISAISILIGGLSFQIEGELNVGVDGNVYIVSAEIMYALVGPLFSLYFIETERDEGQEWDGYFWATFQTLIAVLIMLWAIYGENQFALNLAFLIQYVIAMGMLLVSSKSIKASVGFILGTGFPIIAAIIGMANTGIRFIGFGILMMLLVVFFGYQIDTERELLNKKAELSENKVSLLMEQIHPHFIYNALQQIALLCDEEPESVKPAIFSFSGFLRKNFEALTNESMIPFMEEMTHVDTYIELADILPSRTFTVTKDLKVTDFSLPALVVQPLVENAIQYGVGMSTEGDEILIETKEEGGYIIIRVVDDGRGKQTEISTQRKHKSVGTKNVKTRLKILCDGELSINKTEKGTESVIRIPSDKARVSGEDAAKKPAK